MNMFGNWTVGRRLVAGFGLAALTLVVIGVVSYRSVSRLIENDAWVAHTYQVRAELANLLSQLKDAEAVERGYIIAGEESYLAPFLSATGAIKETLADVRKLTADNPTELPSP
jgi:CHASE3 domain sensor protein